MMGERFSSSFKCSIVAIFLLSMIVVFQISSPLFAEEVNLKLQEEAEVEMGLEYQTEVISVDQVEPLRRIYEITLNQLDQTKQDKISRIKELIQNHIVAGTEQQVPSLLGNELGTERNFKLSYLGHYCTEVLPNSGESIDLQLEFLKGFAYGYGKSGILVFSKEGIEKFYIYNKNRGSQFKIASADKAPNKLDRIYVGKDYVFVPYKIGEILKVDLLGSKTGIVRMWKIMSGGINTKTWNSGKWEKEITVRGDKLF